MMKLASIRSYVVLPVFSSPQGNENDPVGALHRGTQDG